METTEKKEEEDLEQEMTDKKRRIDSLKGLNSNKVFCRLLLHPSSSLKDVSRITNKTAGPRILNNSSFEGINVLMEQERPPVASVCQVSKVLGHVFIKSRLQLFRQLLHLWSAM